MYVDMAVANNLKSSPLLDVLWTNKVGFDINLIKILLRSSSYSTIIIIEEGYHHTLIQMKIKRQCHFRLKIRVLVDSGCYPSKFRCSWPKLGWTLLFQFLGWTPLFQFSFHIIYDQLGAHFDQLAILIVLRGCSCF